MRYTTDSKRIAWVAAVGTVLNQLIENFGLIDFSSFTFDGNAILEYTPPPSEDAENEDVEEPVGILVPLKLTKMYGVLFGGAALHVYNLAFQEKSAAAPKLEDYVDPTADVDGLVKFLGKADIEKGEPTDWKLPVYMEGGVPNTPFVAASNFLFDQTVQLVKTIDWSAFNDTSPLGDEVRAEKVGKVVVAIRHEKVNIKVQIDCTTAGVRDHVFELVFSNTFLTGIGSLTTPAQVEHVRGVPVTPWNQLFHEQYDNYRGRKAACDAVKKATGSDTCDLEHKVYNHYARVEWMGKIYAASLQKPYAFATAITTAMTGKRPWEK